MKRNMDLVREPQPPQHALGASVEFLAQNGPGRAGRAVAGGRAVTDQPPDLPPADAAAFKRAARINAEQTKLFATWLNTMAAHTIALGVIGLSVGYLYGTVSGGGTLEGATPFAAVWVAVGTVLHFDPEHRHRMGPDDD